MFGNKNKVIIKVDGMHCEHCAKKVSDAIVSINKNYKVKVNLKSKEVTITSKDDIDIDNVKENVNKTSFTFMSVNK